MRVVESRWWGSLGVRASSHMARIRKDAVSLVRGVAVAIARGARASRGRRKAEKEEEVANGWGPRGRGTRGGRWYAGWRGLKECRWAGGLCGLAVKERVHQQT
jgi:hypothetical protein